MLHSHALHTLFALMVVAVAARPVAADSIGINFVGGYFDDNLNGAALAPKDLAGVHGPENPDLRQTNWNNFLPGNVLNGPLADLMDHAGTPTMAAISVSDVNNLWSIPTEATDPDRKLMRGYLDTTSTSVTRIQFTGIPYASYDLVVFADGSEEGERRVGGYQITGLPTVYLFDNANFDGVFTEVPLTSTTDLGTNTPAGNYIRFQGMSASSLNLAAIPGSTGGTLSRAPINAVQIVQTPEPASGILLAFGAVAILLGRVDFRGLRRARFTGHVVVLFRRNG